MYRSPGVYNKEIDESLYVAGAATAVTGMVGVAEKGPVGDPTLVTNWPQFVETFGGFITDGYLAYAAKGFFDNGGSVLYVVRTAHYTDATDASTLAAASSTIDVTLQDGTTVAFTATATSPGTWADGLQVNVDFDTAQPYTVEVQDSAGTVLESFRNVQDTVLADTDYVEKVINGASRYITVEVDAGSMDQAASFALTGGDDGLASIEDADYIGDSAAKTGMYALDDVETLKMVAIPGIETPAVHTAVGTYAENRGTVFAVLGTPEGLGPTDVIDYRNGEGTYTHSSFAAPYASMYWPWVKMYDPLTASIVNVPVEGHVLGMIAQSDADTDVWFAPAGLNRGHLANVLGVEYKTTLGERDEVYDNDVNAIASFRGDGVVVWGQKVLASKPSALDRVNVRRLLNYMKESLRDTSRFLLFEPNDKRTWEAFKRFSVPFLQTIKDGRGLYDFAVVCDETTNTPYYIDNNQMVAKIFVKPTKAVEFLEIQYIVTGSGANFEELL